MQKKLLFLSAIITVFTSGCSLMGTKMYSCSSTNVDNNGLTTKIYYDVDYTNDTVDKVKLTYDYEYDNLNEEKNNTILENMIDEDIDGLNADTDGNSDSDNDEIIDGLIGDTFDAILNGVTDTILDLAGLKKRHNIASDRYSDVEGLTIDVEDSTDRHYKVVYTIDMAKISDDDLKIFNLSRSFKELKSIYSSQNLICK